MPRFFIQATPESGLLFIEGEDAHHMVRVLRMKAGDEVTLCNSAGSDYGCVIESASPERIRCRVCSESASAGEPTIEAALYMALPKSGKLELVIQKSVELGVSRIVPFWSARCIAKPAGNQGRRRERWQKIAAEAAKQCGRGKIPEVAEPVSFAAAVSEAARAEAACFFYECERETTLRGVIGGRALTSISLLTGPEGGFSLEEAARAKGSGLTSVSLGKRILRCETAPLAALAAVMYESGNL